MANSFMFVRMSHREWWLPNYWRVQAIWWHYSFGWKHVCDIYMFGPDLVFPRAPTPPSGFQLN
jgi:hypothetical protein